MKRFLLFLLAVTFVLGMVTVSQAIPVFYVNPGTNPALDQTWQSAVGNSFVEFDLDGLGNGTDVDTLTAGALIIDVGLSDPTGTITSPTADIFWGAYSGGGGVYGTVSGGALLNRDAAGNFLYSDITFSFSNPVFGVGAWIFDDDNSVYNSSLMTVTEVGGTIFTSPILESGNGFPHAVEGWLAATSTVGITQVSFRVLDGNNQPTVGGIELDHLQVAQVNPVPEPSTLFLLGSGLAGLVGLKRRLKAKTP